MHIHNTCLTTCNYYRFPPKETEVITCTHKLVAQAFIFHLDMNPYRHLAKTYSTPSYALLYSVFLSFAKKNPHFLDLFLFNHLEDTSSLRTWPLNETLILVYIFLLGAMCISCLLSFVFQFLLLFKLYKSLFNEGAAQQSHSKSRDTID